MKYIILLCGLLFFSGCTQPFFITEEETINLQLPQWPPESANFDQYPKLSRWLLKTGSSTSLSTEYLSPESTTITVSVKKNKPFSATILPITEIPASNGKETSYFLPAGLIYPYSSTSKNCFSFTWNQGFLADAMVKIFTSKKETGTPSTQIDNFIGTFNWKKAQETIDKKILNNYENSSSTFYNPWLLDSHDFLESICYDNFKVGIFNLSGCYSYFVDDIFPEKEILPLSSFIPENHYLINSKQLTLKRDTQTLVSDGIKYAAIIKISSSKKMSKEIIYLPIYITEI